MKPHERDRWLRKFAWAGTLAALACAVSVGAWWLERRFRGIPAAAVNLESYEASVNRLESVPPGN